MKTLVILLLLSVPCMAGETMLVGGKLDTVPSYLNIQPLGLTGIVAGVVRDRDTRDGISRVLVISSGIGATQTTSSGQYMLSEIPGRWTLRFSKTGYTAVSRAVTIDSVDDYVRLDVTMTCSTDTDGDGVCDVHDNCFDIPNGEDAGTCVCSDPMANGMPCMVDRDCDTCLYQGFCSTNQEDSEPDAGLGDACSSCVENVLSCCYYYWN